MTELLYDQKFDLCRRHIEIARQKEQAWEDMPPAGMSEERFDRWLQDQKENSFLPSLDNTPAERARIWSATAFHSVLDVRPAARRSPQFVHGQRYSHNTAYLQFPGDRF